MADSINDYSAPAAPERRPGSCIYCGNKVMLHYGTRSSVWDAYVSCSYDCDSCGWVCYSSPDDEPNHEEFSVPIPGDPDYD